MDDATRNDLDDEFPRQRADHPSTRIRGLPCAPGLHGCAASNQIEINDIYYISDLYKPIKIHIL